MEKQIKFKFNSHEGSVQLIRLNEFPQNDEGLMMQQEIIQTFSREGVKIVYSQMKSQKETQDQAIKNAKDQIDKLNKQIEFTENVKKDIVDAMVALEDCAKENTIILEDPVEAEAEVAETIETKAEDIASEVIATKVE